ncbi:MAG TPA: TonB family protein [Bdellovibrionales bacterium]|nr:TonB family protein [Bdellovibrionales bacterium]
MGEVIAAPNFRISLMASVALHAAVIVALAYRIAVRHEIVPIGVEITFPADRLAAPGPLSEAKPMKVKRAATPVLESKPEIKVEESAAVESTPTAPAVTGPAGKADGQAVSALERYKYELRLYLESRLIYPESAKRLRQTGTVMVRFKVAGDGSFGEPEIVAKSPAESLNRAAVELIRRAASFKALPEGQSEIQLTLPIEYFL